MYPNPYNDPSPYFIFDANSMRYKVILQIERMFHQLAKQTNQLPVLFELPLFEVSSKIVSCLTLLLNISWFLDPML